MKTYIIDGDIATRTHRGCAMRGGRTTEQENKSESGQRVGRHKKTKRQKDSVKRGP